jgi:hypothetical protein
MSSMTGMGYLGRIKKSKEILGNSLFPGGYWDK